MLTVLQVVPRLDTGGVERTAVDVAGAIVKAGGRALVASAGGRLEGELAQAGGELVRLPAATKNPWVMWRNAQRLKAVITERKVSLVHARSRAPAWSALIAARRAGVPFITTYAGAHKAGNAFKRLYNSVMARGDAVICNSAWTEAHVRALYPFAGDRLIVIPRGTDLSAFAPGAVSAQRRAAMRAFLGLADGEGPVILLPGRLTRWKGQLVLIEALGILNRRGKIGAAVAVIAGDAQGRDDFVTEVRAAIAQAGLGACVRLVPEAISDMAAALDLADIVVSASTEPEAFGRIAVEASAMGRLVIASDHGGARETIVSEPEGERTGLRVPPGDAAALAEAIAGALALPADVYRAITLRARSHARRFTLEAMTQQTLAVYEDVLRPRRRD